MRFAIENVGEVSAFFERPAEARCLLLLAHGAGAGMNHPFMSALAAALAVQGVATFRYQFPYMEQRRHVPDSPKTLRATVAAAARAARTAAPDLPLFAGGKSLGGRMTSEAAGLHLLEGALGLVFFGFPLHPPGHPATKRADQLARVSVPMLFIQGTRDAFAELPLLRQVCEKLGSSATLHLIEDADHSFHVPKRSGRSDAEVLAEMARVFASWAQTICSDHR
jgi:predicted alpha/beta-hydrolase family hydrolase